MAKSIDYGNLMHKAMRGLIQTVLNDVAANGLPGEHHFFITFDTTVEGVEMADWLRARQMHRNARKAAAQMADEIGVHLEQSQIFGTDPGIQDAFGQTPGAGAEFDHTPGFWAKIFGHGLGQKARRRRNCRHLQGPADKLAQEKKRFGHDTL